MVAGSYSDATRRQNEWLAENGGTVFALDALELATREDFEVPVQLCKLLRADATCLLKITRNREEVHRFFKEKGKTGIEAGERIAAGLARVVQKQWALRARKELCSPAVKRPAPLRACSGSERSGWAQISSQVCLLRHNCRVAAAGGI